MTKLLTACGSCRGQLAPEDYFCACCGTQARSPGRSRPASRERALKVFHCRSCGASMSFSAQEGGLACPFCDSVDLSATSQPVTLEPERQVPFRVSREDAETAIRTWLQGRWWSPGDLGVAARIEDLQALELPCWVFSATTESSWAADSSRTPAGSKGDWVPMTGEHQGAYQNLYVVASGILEPGEIQGVLPFDLCQTAPESAVEEFSRVREPFAFGRKYARPQARDQLRELVREACRKLVPGRCRNLHLEVRVVQMTSEPVLVPVWIVAYRYRGGLYRILLNGQSPRIAGSAPVSWLKVTLMVLLALSLLAVAVWALSR